MKKTIVFAILLGGIFGCTHENISHEDSGVIITISKVETRVKPFCILRDIIPLQTSWEEMNYLAELEVVESMDNRFYIMDSRRDKVMIFDESGCLIKQIANKGRAENEYVGIAFFSLDRINKKIIIADHFGSKALIYNALGEFEKTISFSTYVTEIYPYGEDKFMMVNEGHKEMLSGVRKNHDLTIYDNKGNEITSLIPSMIKNHVALTIPNGTVGDDGAITYSPHFTGKLFRIENGISEIEYSFVSLDKQYRQLSQKQLKSIEYTPMSQNSKMKELEKAGHMMYLGYFLESDEILFMLAGFIQRIHIFHDKSSNSTIAILRDNINNISTDPLNSHLLYKLPLFMDGRKVGISMTYHEIVKLIPYIDDPRLKSICEGITENDNPVLIMYEITDINNI